MRLLGRRVHLRDAKAAALIVAGKVDETTAVALLGFTLAPHPFLSIILTVLLKTLPAFLPGLALFLWGQSSRPAFLHGQSRGDLYLSGPTPNSNSLRRTLAGRGRRTCSWCPTIPAKS